MGLLRGKREVASERTAIEDNLVQAAIRAQVDQIVADGYTRGFTDGVVATTTLALGESIDGAPPYPGEIPEAFRLWLEIARERARP